MGSFDVRQYFVPIRLPAHRPLYLGLAITGALGFMSNAIVVLSGELWMIGLLLWKGFRPARSR
jgi:hypothetical protein